MPLDLWTILQIYSASEDENLVLRMIQFVDIFNPGKEINILFLFGLIQYYQSQMMNQMFNAPFYKYADRRLELQQVQQDSPTHKKTSYPSKQSNSEKMRNQKLRKLPYQIQNLIQTLITTKYQQEINQISNPQYLKVKNTQHSFYGQTSILKSSNTFLNHQVKVAEGLCEIFFEQNSYLIGYFFNGKLQSQFMYVLQNGDYIKAQKKRKIPKRSFSGFRTDDTESLESSNSEQSDNEDIVEESNIKIKFQDEKSIDRSPSLQCQILFNEIYYQGLLKDGKLHGKIFEKAKDYEFIGHFSMGQRKQGRFVSSYGFQYDGTFRHNKFDGLGTLKTKDGIYNGQFKNGLKDGEGQFKWCDGSSYKGDFRKDQRHGKGFFKSAQGSFKGQWENDKIQGTGYLVLGKKGVGGEWRKNTYEKPNQFF